MTQKQPNPRTTGARPPASQMPPKRTSHKSADIISQHILDHCWAMYRQGKMSADHTSKQVFEQVLQSFANWLKNAVEAESKFEGALVCPARDVECGDFPRS